MSVSLIKVSYFSNYEKIVNQKQEIRKWQKEV